MIKITFIDKNNNLIKTIQPKSDKLVNNRLKRPKSILDIALDNGIDIKFGCMGGSCSACKCQIIKGENQIDKEGLKKAVYKDIGNKEFLPCIAILKENQKENEEIEIKLLL